MNPAYSVSFYPHTVMPEAFWNQSIPRNGLKMNELEKRVVFPVGTEERVE